MSKHRIIPPIRKYMSTSPHTIGFDQTMASAHALMRKEKIRHLPVLSAEKLVGLVSEGDLYMVESLHDVDPSRVLVDQAMSHEVYIVSPDAPVDEVVQEMARHKYGSAVIVDNHKVVGVFTTIDVCQAFADMLQSS